MADLNRFRVLWTGVPGSPAYSNFYFLATTGAEMLVQADALMDTIEHDIGLVDNRVNVTLESSVAVIDEATGEMTNQLSVPDRALVGTSTATALPSAAQIVIRHQTTTVKNGRLVRGRYYMPYVTIDSSSVDGQVAIVTRASLDTAWEDLIDRTSGAWGVYSRPGDSGAGVLAPITGVSTWAEYGVQRSRRP